jgi:CBS domain-containing membrane protein
MTETSCPKCGAPLESDEEICGTCEATVDSEKSPSKIAPPPPPMSSVTPPDVTPAPERTAEPEPEGVPRLVGDIMTRKVATLFEGESLEEAEKGFRKVRFRHVPVVGSDGYLIGLLSLRHVLRALPSPFEPDADARKGAILSKYRVGDIMARGVKTVSASTPLAEAGQLMLEEKRDCLPVVDEDGRLIGLVTVSDYLRLAVRFLKS